MKCLGFLCPICRWASYSSGHSLQRKMMNEIVIWKNSSFSYTVWNNKKFILIKTQALCTLASYLLFVEFYEKSDYCQNFWTLICKNFQRILQQENGVYVTPKDNRTSLFLPFSWPFIRSVLTFYLVVFFENDARCRCTFVVNSAIYKHFVQSLFNI